MNNSSRPYKISGFALLVLFWVLVLASPGLAGLNYSGTYEGREQDSGAMLYTYDHNVGLNFSQKLTNLVSATEQGRYSYRLNSEEVVKETLSKHVEWVDTNPLYRLSLSFYDTVLTSDGQQQSEGQTLEANFKGAWANNFYPGLAFGVTQTTTQQTYQAGLPTAETTQFNTILDWVRSGWDLYYNYRFYEANSGAGLGTQTSDAHHGRLQYRDTYWQDKFRLRFEQDYTQNFREVSGGTVGALWSRIVAGVSTGNDTTPANSIEDPSVVNNNLLRDGDLLTSAYPVGAGSTFNNIMVVLNNQSVSEIHLYTNPGFAVDPGLTWSLYRNDLLGTPWDTITGAITGVTYNPGEKRFEIQLTPVLAKYLKLVVNAGPAVVFTEVRLFDRIVSITPSDKRSTSATTLALGAVLSEKFQLDYLAEYEISEVEGNVSSDNDELYQRIGLAYDSQETSRANLSFSIREEAELESRNYSFGYDKEFFPTLAAGLNVNKSESYVSSLLTTETTSYRLDATAQLYPDLDMTAGLTTSLSGYLSKDIWQDVENTSADVSLTARLQPGTTLHFSEIITDQQGLGSSTTSETTSAYLSWRISEAIFLSVQGNYKTESPASKDSMSLSTNLTIALNSQTRLTAKYAYAYTEQPVAVVTTTPITPLADTIQSGSLELKWTPRAGFGVEGGVSYRDNVAQDEQEFLTYGKLNVNFRLP